MSVKFQITLPEPLMAQLKRASVKARLSVAELIRQTMDDCIRMRSQVASKRDPFADIDGLVSSNETDLATRVDETLYHRRCSLG